MLMKGALYYKLDNLVYNLGPKIRQAGQNLFKQGVALQGEMGHVDKLQPSLRCIPISNSKYPKTLLSDWVAPNAVLIGDVNIGEGSSIWHGVTLRGDTAQIQIGKNSVIQDNSRVASNSLEESAKVVIGDNVFVGANVRLDQCELESFAYVGMGATVGKGSVVESFAVLAAGADLPENSVVPSGQIFAGSPARYLRDLTQQEKHLIGEHHLESQQLAQVYNEMTELTLREQIEQRDDLIKYSFQDFQEKVQDKLSELGMPLTHDDLEYIEQRVYHDYVGTVDYGLRDQNSVEDSVERSYQPYEQDLSHYPEVLKKYQENYSKYDKIKQKFEQENQLEEQNEGFIKQTPKNMAPWETKYDTLLPRYIGTSCQ